jgi:hypothetical protein
MTAKEKWKFLLCLVEFFSLILESNEFTGLELTPLQTDAGILGNIGAETGQIAQTLQNHQNLPA